MRNIKILITKFITQLISAILLISALLVPLDKNREKDKSNSFSQGVIKKVYPCDLTLIQNRQNIAISTKLGEIVYFTTREKSKRFSPRVIHDMKSTFLACIKRYFSPDFG